MLVSQDLKFQSYLYGIEMIDAEHLKGEGKGFNRTFMELKYNHG